MDPVLDLIGYAGAGKYNPRSERGEREGGNWRDTASARPEALRVPTMPSRTPARQHHLHIIIAPAVYAKYAALAALKGAAE